MEKEREILPIVKIRKAIYFGHVRRNDKHRLFQLILQGKIPSKRGPSRRRTFWLKNLRQWTGITSVVLFRSAANKVIWINVFANI